MARFPSFLLCLCASWLLIVCADNSDTPVGHKMKLGSHRPMEGIVETLDYVPHPIDFYEQYSVPSKPVILKGAARQMPSFKLWTDKYMKDNYGSEEVAVEPGKKENRTRVAIEGHQLEFGEFLDAYNESDIYMVDSVPKPMEKEFRLLKCILCGGYTKFLSMTNFWFSSGGTKSVLHNDDADNINCVMSGKKELFMAHKKYENTLPMTRSGHIAVDVDSVDMIKTPTMKDVKWWLAEIEAGDCVFIPQFWLHQVRSTGRNLAVNLWWHFFYSFNYTDCMTKDESGAEVRKELPDYAPFTNFKLNEGESHRKRFADHIVQNSKKKAYKMTKKSIMEIALSFLGPEDEEETAGEDVRERAEEFGRSLIALGDKNGDKGLDLDELYAIDADVFLDAFGEPKTGYNLDDLSTEAGKRGEEDDLDLDFDEEPDREGRDEL